MLDLESLRYDAGFGSKNKESYSGIGAKNGSKAWVETYNKIMNSNESVNFYLVASQDHLNEIIAKDFAMSANLENLRKESNILNIIKPLSKENNDVYMRVVNEFGLENIGDKIKSAGKKVWTVIKEAFKKLRLVFTNIVQAIRKALASIFNGGDAKKILENWNEVTTKAAKSNKTIKTPAFSPKRWLKMDDFKVFIDNIKTAGARMNNAAERASSQLESDKANFQMIKDEIKNSIAKINSNTVGNINTSKVTNIVKLGIFGQNKPVSHPVSIKTIIAHKSSKYLIEKATLEEIKNLSNEMDRSINAISKILNAIEKIEKKAEIDPKEKKEKDSNKMTGKQEKSQRLQTLQLLRTRLTHYSMIGKELFIVFVQVRKTVIRAANVALGESDKDDK